MKAPTSSDKRLQLFQNQWLEKLTVISVGWFVAIWSSVLVWLGVSAWGSTSLLASVLLIGAGWLVFTLVEYATHRFLFHWTPKTDLVARVVFVMHGNHHIQPMDKLRSLMPPIVSFPIGIAVWTLMEFALGSAAQWTFFGFVLGYIAYDLTHYASHQWPMRGRLGQRLKRHHMLHHFVSEEGNYAVTALFWDRVFGTHVQVGKRKKADQAASSAELEPAE